MIKKWAVSAIAVILIITMLSGCSNNQGSSTDDETTDQAQTSGEVVEATFDQTDSDMFTNRDYRTDYDESQAVVINLNGSKATATSDTVSIKKDTITITEDATHIIKGDSTDFIIVVDASDSAKIQIVLDNVNMSAQGANVYVKQANKVFVTAVGQNTLSSTGDFEKIDDENVDAVFYSKQDVTFNGSGSLTVSSANGHAIVGKDDVVFTSGSYDLTSASHGIKANDSVRITTAEICVNAGKDAIHIENSDDTQKGFAYISSGTLSLEAQGDGLSASGYIHILDGHIDIVAGGGYENGTKESSDSFGQFGGGKGGMMMQDKPQRNNTSTSQSQTTDDTQDDSSTSMKGIKASNSILIAGGKFSIDSADDSVHSNLSVTVNGGDFSIASGDDAIHGEENLTINDGTINISNSYEGLEALNITVAGGDISLVASDDGLNAAGGTDSSGQGGRDAMGGGAPNGFAGGGSSNSNGSILISGGKLYINASGDGIDANGTLKITGGYTVVEGPTQGDTATLDYDVSATITGGTFIGSGASNMAQTFSDSSQGIIAISVGSQQSGTKITVADSSGSEILAHTPSLSYQVAILSCPEFKSGETYNVTVGSSSAEIQAN